MNSTGVLLRSNLFAIAASGKIPTHKAKGALLARRAEALTERTIATTTALKICRRIVRRADLLGLQQQQRPDLLALPRISTSKMIFTQIETFEAIFWG